MAADFSRDIAVRLDQSDPLSAFRSRFELPLRADGSPQAYFAGNSLGALPRSARDAVSSVIENHSKLEEPIDWFLPLTHIGLRADKELARAHPDLPLIDKNKVVNPKVTPKDQEALTTQYTERAVKFIEQHKDEPFLVYLPHSMVHVPLYVSDKFKGKSGKGLVS